ncbi:B3 domain-containing transcription factor VRN1-like [Silene latifolia]|uniref:B3 domain-containing transcription factor VRN1-like n=1 Tax=Silene latifolia TaxID=37657 RepID=UPI003D774AE1
MAVDDLPHNFPSFFKIILEPRHDLRKLAIPKKFLTDHGNDLLDVVSLKIPTGKTWEVELLKENGRAWFNDGWNKVVNFCSICHGHFLMFNYEGKSQFNVYIFDMTACEIEYPLDRHETREVQKKVSEIKAKINSDAPISSPEEKGMGALVREYIRKFGTLNQLHIKMINSYQFDIPSFTVVMQPSYVSAKYCVNVPLTFGGDSGEHTSIKPGRSYTLENSSGDTWTVRCIGSTLKYKKFYMGWKQFALDHNLQVGDICVFELIKVSKRLFKVEIIRSSSDSAAAGAVTSPSSSMNSEDGTED